MVKNGNYFAFVLQFMRLGRPYESDSCPDKKNPNVR
jgi:hypothetical protein